MSAGPRRRCCPSPRTGPPRGGVAPVGHALVDQPGLRLDLLPRTQVDPDLGAVHGLDAGVGGPHNLGGLYLLPEVRADRFAGFHAVRAELEDGYRQLLAATTAGGALARSELDLRTDLLFGLIEGVILVHRSDPERPVSVFAEATADAALRIAGI
ncbi:hypothetical protein [Streptomyces regalis]|uniref:hypothetical protein n=1 Tax=Streptomyces regalis TaxID=68262 RepID=UPI003CC5CFAE